MSIVYKLTLKEGGRIKSFYLVPGGRQVSEFFETNGVGLMRISDEALEEGIRVSGNGEYTVSCERLNEERTEGMLPKIIAAR